MGLMLAACVTDIEDPEPPEPPEWVYPAVLGEFPREGVRPVAGEDALLLEWQPSQEADIAGYQIYRADSSLDVFEIVGTVEEKQGNLATEFQDTTVPIDTLVYYYLRAIDDSDNKSDPSDTLKFVLLQKSGLSQFKEPPDQKPVLEWNISPPESNAGFYLVELADDSKNTLTVSPVIPRTSYARQAMDSWTVPDSLEPGAQYFWRVYASGLLDEEDRPHAMSLSGWRTFTVRE
ncbi:MAG: hypothetical protein K9N46_15975 [Candidatus Marinimicrobia bacterium]|nr:hypothetical protein [Candidatus Neomarinimicrobiota bacterium]MCF7830151.1 hypothetical protein [Candidatus Neomarinimicrobiota bacterium]MCF7882228.1 hypothetical protein [Candidatus Neomarinimicrobiota bacterium]